jgi:excisionase family DNA binding protein
MLQDREYNCYLILIMAKRIGDIKLYSVRDLHKALGVNERTLREWFNKGRLKGVKIGTEWHITEENLKRFLNAEESSIKSD